METHTKEFNRTDIHRHTDAYMITTNQIIDLLSQKIEGTDCFLVDVIVKENNNICIYIDSDKGITIDQCAQMNRFLEERLDRNTEDFSIEVSSPGIGSPFKVYRQYEKNIGRDVIVTLIEGKRITGKLTSVSPQLLEILTKSKKVEYVIFNTIKETKEVLPFSHS